VFVDVLIKGKKFKRLEKPGSVFEISDLPFPKSTLPALLPLQRCPLPREPRKWPGDLDQEASMRMH
jgi:hypothetical protein